MIFRAEMPPFSFTTFLTIWMVFSWWYIDCCFKDADEMTYMVELSKGDVLSIPRGTSRC
jgi:hypothetical protein